MTQRSLTVVLAGALLAACSKPNPLFLDTWDGVSDSGSNSETATNPTLTDPPVTTTSTPTTTTPTTVTSTTETPPTTSTSTTSTSGVTTEDPETVGTTEDVLPCEPDMEGCCEVEIGAAADNFFTNAHADVGNSGCPLVPNPEPDQEMLPCEFWSFGKAPKLQLFNDYEVVWISLTKGASALALRFPTKNGELVAAGQQIPWALVKSMVLELTVEIDWAVFSDLDFQLLGLPADQTWTEGDDQPEMVPCVDNNSSYRCRACGPTILGECAGPWDGADPLMALHAVVPGVQGAGPDKLEIEIAETSWLANFTGGLVVLPNSSKIDGQAFPQVPSGALFVHARESGSPPTLRARVCMP